MLDPALEEGLSIPTEADLASVVQMRSMAFAEKRGCCGSKAGPLSADEIEDEVRGMVKQLLGKPKMQHCRVFKAPDGQVLGTIQLQLWGDPGDPTMPSEDFQHVLEREDQAYVEFIACDPNATGKGIGSRLLKWSDAFAASQGCTEITLEVMRKNPAVGLYERKGYDVYEGNEDCCDSCIGRCFVFCCLGCTYCTVLKMKKTLTDTSAAPAPPEMPQMLSPDLII